jgi:pyrroline-5-carboxylate reductase
MGEAILSSVLRAKVAAPSEVVVVERLAPRRQTLEASHDVSTEAEAGAALDAGQVLLSVKPGEFDKLAESIAGRLPATATVVSIMAGVPIARISNGLQHKAIVRAMPNTPAQIGEGMTIWTATPTVSEEAKAEVARIFESMGHHAYVDDEHYLDMATAVLGSGPGFVLLLIEAMIDAGVHIGMTRDLAAEVVLRTFAGTASLAQKTGRHPADLRNMVTSPGGTTAEGLRVLESAAVRASLIDAVIAAYNRSKALGGETISK